MALSEQQRLARQKNIGSSDSPAILGVDPYRSAADVYLEKIGQADGFAGNANTDRGNLLEPVLLSWAGNELNTTLRRDELFVHPGGILCANLDGIGPDFLVEAKTSSDPAEWGEPGTDEVPERVIVQTHHAMAVTGFRLAYVPVLLPGFRSFDFRMYRVAYNPSLGDAVVAAGERFWREHVEVRVRPDDYRPSMEVLKRVRREPSKTVAVNPGLVDFWERAKELKRTADKREEEAKRELLAALDDAEAGDCGDGRTVTYMETTRRGYEVAECTYRQLRLKAAKGSK
jgi:putative phage-type endonuclease